MPGRRINRTQVAKYMEYRKELEQEPAAAKAGISVRSERRIERAGGLPSKREARQWRTRVDPLSRWWVSDIARIVRVSPGVVRKWITRFNALGLDGLQDQPRSCDSERAGWRTSLYPTRASRDRSISQACRSRRARPAR